MVLDPNMDSYNYKHVNNPKARDKLLSKIYEKNIVDPFRETFPLKKMLYMAEKKPSKTS